MMVGTVLGPGSIFLMLVGAFGVAFGLANWTSFLINLVPITIFISESTFRSFDIKFNQILTP